eukprot:1923002-Amphidinium_carterae.1
MIFRPDCAHLSQCDMHFFAGVLHEYPQIPTCHVHVILPASELGSQLRPTNHRTRTPTAFPETTSHGKCPSIPTSSVSFLT